MEPNLQFDQAEFTAPQTVSCGVCKATLSDAYYEANGEIFCQSCSEAMRAQLAGAGSRIGRLTHALLFGLGAGILGTIIYYAVRAITGYEVGLVAIVVGYLVGGAVRKGSGGRGGWRYQVIAALITYAAIAATYVPMAIEELRKSDPAAVAAASTQNPAPAVASEVTAAPQDATAFEATPETSPAPTTAALNPDATTVEDPAPAVDPDEVTAFVQDQSAPVQLTIAGVLLLGLALSLPILVGVSSPITLLIVGFGVWEAWRLNKRAKIEFTGPHAIAPAVSA